MRGNPDDRSSVNVPTGPIPARAGKPSRSGADSTKTRAYPRSCGETPMIEAVSTSPQGLSPLVRGNRPPRSVATQTVGPIPARAGKPPIADFSDSEKWAYPRSCGETRGEPVGISTAVGLSPLVRGNRSHRIVHMLNPGPIPARAGKPAPRRRWSRQARAYPRSCGETPDEFDDFDQHTGLSPLVRGNLIYRRS